MFISGDLDKVARQVARGERDYVATHAGRSQYSAGGTSACGLVALNCARVVLRGDQTGSYEQIALLQYLMRRETSENILQICLQWSSSAHLDVEEIYTAPLFKASLALQWTDYNQPGLPQFERLLRRLDQSTTSSAALIITRPPEILCVLKIAAGSVTDTTATYVTFDSHPRSKHPDGAAFIFHRSLTAAAFYLSDLLQYDPQLLADPALHWQAQLLAQYSAHAFVAKPDGPTLSPDAEQILVDASLEVLKLNAEIAELREVNRTLESDSNSLLQENARLESRVEDLEDLNSRMSRKMDTIKQRQKTSSTGSAHATSGRSALGSLYAFPPLDRPSKSSIDWPPAPSPHATYTSTSSTPPSTIRPSAKGKLPLRAHNRPDIDDESFAAQVQLEWQDEEEHGDDYYLMSLRIQRRFEEEDRQLRSQMQHLMDITPKTFNCGICMECLPEDVVARAGSCGHSFCRPRLLQYLQSKLTEHRFPILCPMCAVERGTGEPGVISGDMASQIGLNEQEFAVFTELEMASFSVLLHCRQCQQAVFVDKSEYEAQEIIACPLPGCTHAWCKACSRSIDFAGPKHSCDGTSELNHLMTEQGWKNCPGCRTPTSKTEGCNHMTCIAPGCNTHFCYVCGESIVQSAHRQDIRTALERHYAGCRMIDVPA